MHQHAFGINFLLHSVSLILTICTLLLLDEPDSGVSLFMDSVYGTICRLL